MTYHDRLVRRAANEMRKTSLPNDVFHVRLGELCSRILDVGGLSPSDRQLLNDIRRGRYAWTTVRRVAELDSRSGVCGLDALVRGYALTVAERRPVCVVSALEHETQTQAHADPAQWGHALRRTKEARDEAWWRTIGQRAAIDGYLDALAVA